MKKKLFVILLPFISLFFALNLFKYFVKFMDSSYFFCILYTCTGYYCFGCGGTRAVKAILRGDILQSFIDNPLVIIFSMFLILLYSELFLKTFFKPRKLIPQNKYFYIIMLILITVYFVIRNFIPALFPI